MINGLDLFSGIGGLAVALQEWVKPIAYCEIESYCQGVLLSRMASSDIGTAPIWDDITTFPLESFVGQVDIIYGGFPCQDISIAGVGKGLAGKRSGLFFEMLRVAKKVKPKFIFLENVPSITQRGGIQIVNEIAEMGYDCRWCVISASSIGAIHKRERWFLLAYAHCQSNAGLSSGKEKTYTQSRKQSKSKAWTKWPKGESSLLRMDDGIPFRVDRAKALGNAVVPEQAKKAFKILMGIT